MAERQDGSEAAGGKDAGPEAETAAATAGGAHATAPGVPAADSDGDGEARASPAPAAELDALIATLRGIYAGHPDAVTIADPHRRLVWLNAAAERLFGYPRGALLGRDTAILHADPADVGRTGRARDTDRPAPPHSHHAMRCRRRSGAVFESETTGGPLRAPDGRVLGFLRVMRDVSAEYAFDAVRARLEELAWDQRLDVDGKMAALLDLGCRYFGLTSGAIARRDGGMMVLTHVHDPSGRLAAGTTLALDGSLAGLVAEASSALVGSTCAPSPDAAGGGIGSTVPPAAGAPPAAPEAPLRLAEGVARAWIGAPLVVDDARHGALYFWSGTPRRPFERAERELAALIAARAAHSISRREAMATLADATAAAERASAAKSEFLAALSHDLRTPFTALIGMLELIEQEPSAAERTMLLGHARRAATTLNALLNDALDLVQAEGLSARVATGPVSLKALAEEALAPFAPIAAARGVTIASRIARGLPERILTDRQRLRQAIHKLVSNATKYTAEGRIELRFAPGKRPDTLAIAVADTGIGIAPADQARIFEPFEQAGADEARRETGPGLGLPLCRRLIEALGGRVSVESRPGAGSRFTIEIPCRPAPAAAPPGPAAHAPGDGSPGRGGRSAGTGDAPGLPDARQPRRILLAEDNATSALLLTRMLGRMGHDVVHVADGAAAVEAARADRFDVGVFDMRMPRVDGLTAMRRIHAAEPLDRLPVIALTADGRADGRGRWADPALADFLTKPVDWQALEAAIQTHARGAETRRIA